MFLYIIKFSFHGETRSEFDYDWSVISPWDIVTLMARELARKYLFCFACTPGREGGGEGRFSRVVACFTHCQYYPERNERLLCSECF